MSKRLTTWISVAAAIVTAGTMISLYMSDDEAADPVHVRIASLVLLIGWLTAPYFGLVLLARRWASRGLLVASVVAAASAGIVSQILSKPDGQGAMLLLALPIFQWVVIGISVAVSRVVERPQ